MIVCPVCEHTQPFSGECEVCGKALGPAGAGDAESLFTVSLSNQERLDGLEPTLHAVLRPAQDERTAAPELLAELQPTAAARTGAVSAAPELLAELEPTAAARTGAVDPAPVPDLVPTAVADLPGDGPTPQPIAVLCRYCRSPAMPGERICGHCGMRLPVAAGRPAPTAAPRACSCGLPVSGAVCPGCGARQQDTT
jgi:hypothetical protein